MPPGTTKLLYDVLEPGVKPLRALAVPFVEPCPTYNTQGKDTIRPLPQHYPCPPETPTPTLVPTNDTLAPFLHATPTTPFNLHGSMFDVPLETCGRDGRGAWPSMHVGGAWIRALGKMEVLMAVGGMFGSLNTVQAVRLTSPRPLLPQDVRAALTHVARRTELLQVGVAWRWAWPWFRRRTHITVPFRVMHTPVMAAYYNMLEAPYDMARGPLWRACLVPEEGGAGGVHSAVLVLAVHHCITDAFTNTTLFREVLDVLNAALTARTYLPPIRPLPPPHADLMLGAKEYAAAAAFTVYKFLTSTLGNFNDRVYFRGAVPRPKARHARTGRTRVLHAELTETATTQLRERCRAEGVTVHALVSAAAQLAVLHTAGTFTKQKEEDGRGRGRGVPCEAWVRVFNCVNLRRYFEGDAQGVLGCFISIMEEEQHVTLKDGASGQHVWDLARRGHAALRASLGEERRPLRTLASFTPCSLLIPVNYILTRLGLLNLNDNHVITTNMGDLRPLLHTGPGPITPTHLLRCVSDAYTGHPYTLVLHTFLGRFSVALEYYSTKTARPVARTFFNTLTNLLLDIAATGAPTQGGPHRPQALHQDKFCSQDYDDDDDC